MEELINVRIVAEAPRRTDVDHAIRNYFIDVIQRALFVLLFKQLLHC